MNADAKLLELIVDAETLSGDKTMKLSARMHIISAITLLRAAHNAQTMDYDPHVETRRKTRWEVSHD